MTRLLRIALATVLTPLSLSAQATSTTPRPVAPYDPKDCPSCADWNRPHAPVRIFGNAYYVGTDGLSAMLITSPQGHVLIDAGLPESAAHIVENIRTLGFQIADIKLILNSHAHYDHAGGVAEIARASGAKVVASAASARVLRTGKAGPDDPQFRIALSYPAVTRVETFGDGDTLRVGAIRMVAHLTPGHTPGGTTWTWQSCEGERCLDMVYADSQSAISDNEFKYTGDARYPNAAADFRGSHATIEHLRCDILITPHPGSTNLWARLAARDQGSGPPLVGADACKRYAASAREQFEKRMASEGR